MKTLLNLSLILALMSCAHQSTDRKVASQMDTLICMGEAGGGSMHYVLDGFNKMNPFASQVENVKDYTARGDRYFKGMEVEQGAANSSGELVLSNEKEGFSLVIKTKEPAPTKSWFGNYAFHSYIVEEVKFKNGDEHPIVCYKAGDIILE